MAKVKVVETAARRPGRCAISKETQGPFIDTGNDIPRFGRVYLSLKWLEPLLRNNGVKNFIPESDVDELREENKELTEENRELQEAKDSFDQLVSAVSEYLPTPEPEVREVPVVQYKSPTDEEIEDWIERKGGNHPSVIKARPAEPGSTEEWFALYGRSGPQKLPQSVEIETEPDSDKGLVTSDATGEGPAQIVTLHDQDINLDEVLSLKVGDVLSYTEGKEDEFKAALVRREFFLANRNSRNVRKGILEPLGYWDDEEDEPLLPDAVSGEGTELTAEETPQTPVNENQTLTLDEEDEDDEDESESDEDEDEDDEGEEDEEDEDDEEEEDDLDDEDDLSDDEDEEE